jgi:hypothetical protein
MPYTPIEIDRQNLTIMGVNLTLTTHQTSNQK